METDFNESARTQIVCPLEKWACKLFGALKFILQNTEDFGPCRSSKIRPPNFLQVIRKYAFTAVTFEKVYIYVTRYK